MQNLLYRCRRFGVVVSCGLLVLWTNGCSRPAGPQRVAVQGAILFGGKPLKVGRIRFVPTNGTKGPTAAASVKKGFYEFTAVTGPVVGKHRVEIESIPDAGFELDDEAAYAKAQKEKQTVPLPPQPVPPQYNERSTLVVSVDPRGDKKYDFNLEKTSAE